MYERGGPTNLFKKLSKQKPKQKQKIRRSKNNTTVHEIIKTKRLEETWDFY